MTQRYSRRQVLAGGVTGAAVLGLAAAGPMRSAGADSVRRALRVKPATSGTVEHVVFLMQENRSFDHYFGTMKGVSGFDDTHNSGAFTQAWNTANGGAGAPADEVPPNVLLPFHMNTKNGAGGVHLRPVSRLAGRARLLGQRSDGRLRVHPHLAVLRGQPRHQHHGLLHQGRHPLLLRPGLQVHHLRQLLLLGARAHPPQPADGHLRPTSIPAAWPVAPSSPPTPASRRTRAPARGRPCPTS